MGIVHEVDDEKKFIGVTDGRMSKIAVVNMKLMIDTGSNDERTAWP